MVAGLAYRAHRSADSMRLGLPQLVEWAVWGKCAHCDKPTPLVDKELTIYCCGPACQHHIRLASKPIKVRILVQEYRGSSYNKRSKNYFLRGADFDEVVKRINYAIKDFRSRQITLLPTGGDDGRKAT